MHINLPPLLNHTSIFVKNCNYYYLSVKNIGTAKAYLFQVYSHTADRYTKSDVLKYDLPEGLKARAVTAGLIGGLLFFIVAIILSVCTVKICNKRRRRKQERGNLLKLHLLCLLKYSFIL